MRFHQLGPFKKHFEQSFPEHLSPVYLITGKQEDSRKEALEIVLKTFKKHEVSPFSIRQFDAKEGEFEEIMGEINTLIAFEKKRLVLVHQANALSKGQQEKLNAYFQAPNGSVCLVLEAGYLPKEITQHIEECGVLLEIAVEKPWEKEKRFEQFVDQYVKKQQSKIDPDAKACLLQWIGYDKSFLEKELDKLLSFTQGKARITRQDVALIATHQHQETVWELFDAIFAGRLDRVLRLLRILMIERFQEQMLLGNMRGHFQMLLKLAETKDQQTFNKVMKQYPYLKGKLLEKHRAHATRYGALHLKQALVEIYETELKTREGLDHAAVLLESLLTKLTEKVVSFA